MATDIKNDATLSTNLISCWELEEASGTRVDSHGSNDLTDNNTVGQGTGKQGNCADFEESNNEYLSITDAAQSGLDLTGDFSMAFWGQIEALLTVDTFGFVDKWVGTGSQKAYQMMFRNTGGNDLYTVQLSSNGSTTSTMDLDFGDTLSTATWYHFVLTYDASAGTLEIFRDAVSKDTDATAPTSIFNSNADFLLGTGFGAPYDGLIDQFCIWDKVLSSGEISDLYNSGDGIPYEASGGAAPVSNLLTLGAG